LIHKGFYGISENSGEAHIIIVKTNSYYQMSTEPSTTIFRKFMYFDESAKSQNRRNEYQ